MRAFCPQEVSVIFFFYSGFTPLETQARIYSHFTDEETNSERSNNLSAQGLKSVSDSAETGNRLLTSVTQHSMVTSSPGYTMKVKPEPSKYTKKCFSLILLAIGKQIFARNHVHNIINQKSVIRNIKPQWKSGVGGYTQRVLKFLSNAPGLSSFIEGSFCPRYCAWDTEQIRSTKILPLWS